MTSGETFVIVLICAALVLVGLWGIYADLPRRDPQRPSAADRRLRAEIEAHVADQRRRDRGDEARP